MASSTFLRLGFMALLLVLATAKIDVNLTDKLVDLIKKKSEKAFVDELSKPGMDVNQPDSLGRLPLIEAVRSKDIKLVDALLQYGAFAKSKDPATGATPLHVAFQQNLVQISKLLLQFGADVNVEDKAAKKARDFAPTKEIRDFIISYDKDGAMAFEDEPGSWSKQVKEGAGGDVYWFNSRTSESRWNTPPSCAWQRVEVQGHPIKYINSITGQEVTAVPPSLAWAKVRQDGKDVYYNYKVNASQFEAPGEVPPEVLAEIDRNINVRWHNEKTGEFAWVDPAYHTAWRELTDAATGRTYWYNIESGDSVWDLPDELAWSKVAEEESGQTYYFNKITGDSTWEAPEHLAWVRHDSDL